MTDICLYPGESIPLNIRLTRMFELTVPLTAPAFMPIVNLNAGEVSIIPVEDRRGYKFRLRYVKKDGNRGPWTFIYPHTVAGKTAPPANVGGFSVNQIRDLVTANWVEVPDHDLAGYEFRFGVVGISWADGNPVSGEYKGATFTTPNIPPGTWDVMLKAKDTSTPANYSLNEARKTITVYTFYNILADIHDFPLWGGVLVNFVRDPLTGHLHPESQDSSGGNDNNWVDYYCHNPYEEVSYESPEIDLGADTLIRAWGHIYSNLGPGESGLANPQLQLDYKLGGGVYDGFEKWTIGLLTARYLKFKLVNTAEVGVVRVTDLKSVADEPQ